MACKIIDNIFLKLKNIQEEFGNLTGEFNIYSSSKIYEIIIANMFGHNIVIGTHGADAQNYNNYYEYKHFKESSTNHTWTFNDYSQETLDKLKTKTVFFVHINDIQHNNPFDYIDWYYEVSGDIIANYILKWAKKSGNQRKMVNISASQLESNCKVKRIYPSKDCSNGHYSIYIKKIFECINDSEKITKTTNLLTSNKLWELFLANKLGHKINSKQGGIGGKHDAEDYVGRKFEYKISQRPTWTFEDVSDAVIANMRLLDGIYVSLINKRQFATKGVFFLDTNKTMGLITRKRDAMIRKKKKENEPVKRLNVSISYAEAKREELIIKPKIED